MKSHSQKKMTVPLAPAGDIAFAPLFDSRMRWPIRRAKLQVAFREAFQTGLGRPVERQLLRWWSAGLPGSGCLKRRGLPRRAIEESLGKSLVLHVDPRQLIRSTDWRGYPHKLRPSSSAFIWDGEWDLRRGDLRFGSRYRFISELDECRDDLTRTERFKKYMSYLQGGHPWRSHQQGVLLDSKERILTYLRVYLGFLDHMAVRGFDAARGKDELGVAVTREGRLIKINRGLHRLAMAQRLGLDTVPVRVMAVHREWWERIIGQTTGQAALVLLAEALRDCIPEREPGEFDPAEWPTSFTWPNSSELYSSFHHAR